MPTLDDTTNFLGVLWQVDAAMVSIALVFVILVIQTLHARVQRDDLWRRFLQMSKFPFVTAFLIGTVGSTGLAYAGLVKTFARGAIAAPGIPNLFAVGVLLFGVSLFLLLRLLTSIFRLLAPAFLQNLVKDALHATVAASVHEMLVRQESLDREDEM